MGDLATGMKVINGVVDIIVAATGRRREAVLEEVVKDLQEQLKNPPRAINIPTADKMRDAFERGRAEAEDE